MCLSTAAAVGFINFPASRRGEEQRARDCRGHRLRRHNTIGCLEKRSRWLDSTPPHPLTTTTTHPSSVRLERERESVITSRSETRPPALANNKPPRGQREETERARRRGQRETPHLLSTSRFDGEQVPRVWQPFCCVPFERKSCCEGRGEGSCCTDLEIVKHCWFYDCNDA